MGNEAPRFPQWKFIPGSTIRGGVGQGAVFNWNYCLTSALGRSYGNQRSITPILVDVPNSLWGRDLLEDMGHLITDDHTFYDDIVMHNKIGLLGYPSPDDSSKIHLSPHSRSLWPPQAKGCEYPPQYPSPGYRIIPSGWSVSHTWTQLSALKKLRNNLSWAIYNPQTVGIILPSLLFSRNQAITDCCKTVPSLTWTIP
jgi:hypothetical protein